MSLKIGDVVKIKGTGQIVMVAAIDFKINEVVKDYLTEKQRAFIDSYAKNDFSNIQKDKLEKIIKYNIC